MKYASDFFAFAEERENIRLRRAGGQHWPWTADPVLQTYSFCNVLREDDKTTIWFRENIRDHVDADQAVLACAAFRWFNFVPSGEILKPYLLGELEWNEQQIYAQLSSLDQIISGAYLIKSPPGMDKAAGLLKCLRPIVRAGRDLGWAGEKLNYDLRFMHQEIMQYPYLGRFMAYEVVTDLRHTSVLAGADDTMTWASAGPGCTRGMGWVVADDPSEFSYGSARQERAMLQLMQELLELSQDPVLWPWPDRPWEMREVEHVLCEFAKYRAAQTGARVKRKYHRAHSHDS